ncbi:MAG: YcjF family protein [Sulfitobacter sp.]
MAAATIAKDTTSDAVDERHEKISEIISTSVKWSAAGGVVPLPYLDLIAIGAVQANMVRKLAAVYDLEADEQNVKAIVAALVGTLAPAAISASLLGSSAKLVPFTGTLVGSVGMAAFASASTYAIGKAFVRHFEGGGNLMNFSVDAVKQDLKADFAAAKAK